MSSTQPPDNPDAEEEPTPPPPAAAEDRKALAALSHLETRPNEAEDEEAEAKQLKNKTVDQAQLSAAISRLEVSSDPSGNKGKGTERVKSEAELKREEEKRKELEEQRRRAKVKVDAADVGLLVSFSSSHNWVRGEMWRRRGREGGAFG